MFQTHRHRHRGCVSTAYLIYLSCCGLAFAVAATAVAATSTDPRDQQLQLCPPAYPDHATNTTPVAFYPCSCSSTPTDHFAIAINCKARHINNTLFTNAHQLPPLVGTLDLSANLISMVPPLVAPQLGRLDLSHNRIHTLYDRQFESIGAALRELSLAWNQIDRVSGKAFAGLGQLQRLDLTHNHLQRLALNVFSPVPALRWLDVSRNRELNATLDAPDMDLYISLGVSTLLETFAAEECALHRGPAMVGGVGLRELRLRFNRFEQVPRAIPKGLRVLDVSGNPVPRLEEDAVPLLGELRELWLTDMPNLTAIEAYALVGVPKLRVLSLQGSWRLRRFDSLAFGEAVQSSNATNTEQQYADLERLSVAGTALTVPLNVTVPTARLTQMAGRVKTIDAMGAPIVCDCEMRGFLRGNAATLVGECSAPEELQQRRLAEVHVDELGCRWWPAWVYQVLNGLAVLAMLAVGVTATWCLVTHIRPRSRRERLQKVGDTSPYARVTIEPSTGQL